MLKHPVVVGSVTFTNTNDSTRYFEKDVDVVQRSWGYYKVLQTGKGYKTKLLVVKPFGKSAEQRHFKRKEVWTYVSGQRFGETKEIAPLEWHRLQNDTPFEIFIIETQLGDCQEDDIERKGE